MHNSSNEQLLLLYTASSFIFDTPYDDLSGRLMPFAKLGLSTPLVQAITELGYKTPTPIQEQAIPAILSGNDLIATAQTGTGKTAAFVLPLLERFSNAGTLRGKRIRALILVPTRELAVQVEANVAQYAKHTHLTSMAMYGGVDTEAQKSA
ncbi:hypothetical protein HORIV_40320 [Vreelandella olivaria]|uniref:RNA helicase n=1 Tax=Vreelandella olivaria TaxID=390919 RepID=A0ABN5WXD3_9GAMM|nr:hypothetical protein HORIV_40320 [Halomonas olivaria]